MSLLGAVPQFQGVPSCPRLHAQGKGIQATRDAHVHYC